MPSVRDLFVQDALSSVVVLDEKFDVLNEVLAEAVVDIGFLDGIATSETTSRRSSRRHFSSQFCTLFSANCAA